MGLKTDGLAHLLKTTLGAHYQILENQGHSILANQETLRQDVAKLDAHCVQLLTNSDANQQAFTSKLDASKQTLSSVLRVQQRTSVAQTRLLRTSAQSQKQTASISKKLGESRNISNRNHKVTRDMLETLTAKVKGMEISTTNPTTRAVQSGREIYFLGERRDMIMAYLLSIKDHLKHAVDQILSQRIQGVSTRQACWLEKEFGDLLGSAAQNEAARYSTSTATAFDQWSFSEDTIKSSRSNEKARNIDATESLSLSDSEVKSTFRASFQNRLRRSRQSLEFESPTGTLQISFPQDDTGFGELHYSDEIRISFFSKISQPFVVLDAHFFQKMVDVSRPRVCAQLNIFTPLDDRFSYGNVIVSGTISEIDAAIRGGAVSPYAVMESGNVALLYVRTTSNLVRSLYSTIFC